MIRSLSAAAAAALLALTALAGPAWSATPPTPPEPTATSPVRFVLVGIAPDLTQVGFVDTAGLQRSGKYVTVWSIWIWPELPAYGAERVSYVMRRNAYDCDAGTTRQEIVRIYTETGNKVFDGPPTDRPAFVKIDPGTIGETTLAFVCDGTDPDLAESPATSLQEAVTVGRAVAAKAKRAKTT